MKANLRTIAIAVGTALVATGALAGCSGGSSAASSHSALTIYSDNPPWNPGFVKTGDALKKITGHALTPVSLPSTQNYQQVIQASLATRKPGDIVKWSSGKMLENLAATGNLTDLTSVWNADVKKGWLDDSLRPSYSFNGKVYGLPIFQAYWVVFYNKAVFAQNNIAVPKTYADFSAAAAKLKSAGVTPIWTGQADGWTSFIPYQTILGSISPSFYQKLTTDKASFGDPTSIAAMTEWQQWMKDGWTTPADSKFGDAPALMKSGKLAMFPIGTWDSGALAAAGMQPGTDYGAFFMPPKEPNTKQAVFTEGGAWLVPKNSPNQKAAVTQLSHWLDPSVQGVWSDFLGDSSANPTVVPTNPVIKGLDDEVAKTKPVLMNRYYESFPPNLVQESTSTLDGFMVNPDSLQSTADALKASAQKEWTAWKASK